MLIVGGANGIGLSIADEMLKRTDCEKIYIVDKAPLSTEYQHDKIKFFQFDLTNNDYSFFDKFNDVDSLMITAGFGKLALFKDISEDYIINSFNINTVSTIRLIKHFYNKINSKADFYCGTMVSIAGFMSSPFFSVYAATKAALKVFIESVNVELIKDGSVNCILNVSPGSIKGTSFNQEKTDLELTSDLAKEIISNLEKKNDLFIPQYNDVFENILDRYRNDFRAEGLRSYEYKLQSNRMQ